MISLLVLTPFGKDLFGYALPSIAKTVVALVFSSSYFALTQIARYFLSQDGKRFIKKQKAKKASAKSKKQEKDGLEEDIEAPTTEAAEENELRDDPQEIESEDLGFEKENNNENNHYERSTDNDENNC